MFASPHWHVMFIFIFALMFAPHTAPALERPFCAGIAVSQAGATFLPRNGSFSISRAPFAIIYRGAGKQPSLTLSSSPRLNDRLRALGRDRLLASAGDYMALNPNDMFLTDEFDFHETAESRAGFANLIGNGYAELVEEIVRTNPELNVASSIAKAANDFRQTTDGQAYFIQSINGIPLAKTAYGTLDLTYFTVIDERGPESGGASGMKLLQIVAWDACVIRFK